MSLPELPHNLYSLPKVVAEDSRCADLVELFNVLVVRLQAECAHLPLSTLQFLLLERIASNYILLRYRELIPVGEAGGYSNTKYEKEANTFWLAMTREFNDQLRAYKKGDRESVLAEVRDVIVTTLSEIPDAGTRTDLMTRFTVAFDSLGI